MRRTLGLFIAATAAAGLLSGCMSVYSPAAGVLLTNVYGPIDAGTKVGSKEGEACARSIFGLVARGDASIKAAARAGGITKIDSVDHHSHGFLGIFKFCTIVRGS